ncbi:hypothetical protein [Spirochaeta dissipatitropha]
MNKRYIYMTLIVCTIFLVSCCDHIPQLRRPDAVPFDHLNDPLVIRARLVPSLASDAEIERAMTLPWMRENPNGSFFFVAYDWESRQIVNRQMFTGGDAQLDYHFQYSPQRDMYYIAADWLRQIFKFDPRSGEIEEPIDFDLPPGSLSPVSKDGLLLIWYNILTEQGCPVGIWDTETETLVGDPFYLSGNGYWNNIMYVPELSSYFMDVDGVTESGDLYTIVFQFNMSDQSLIELYRHGDKEYISGRYSTSQIFERNGILYYAANHNMIWDDELDQYVRYNSEPILVQYNLGTQELSFDVISDWDPDTHLTILGFSPDDSLYIMAEKDYEERSLYLYFPETGVFEYIEGSDILGGFVFFPYTKLDGDILYMYDLSLPEIFELHVYDLSAMEKLYNETIRIY